jgi:hypothetical protein
MHVSPFLRRHGQPALLASALLAVLFGCAPLSASAADAMGMSMAASAPMSAEPPARITVDEPLKAALANGALVVQFHTEHLRIAALNTPAAAAGDPRIGHLHLSLDHAAWQWVQATTDPIVMFGLAPGAHTLQVDLANSDHVVLDKRTLEFVVPKH